MTLSNQLATRYWLRVVDRVLCIAIRAAPADPGATHSEVIMAAPKGNQFWKARRSHGPKPKFANPEDLWAACVEYFEWVEDNPLWAAKAFAYQGEVAIAKIPKMRAMTLGGLCIFLDIDFKSWVGWRTKREDLFHVTTRVEEIIRQQKFEGAAANLLNANIIARDLGLADRKEHSGRDGGPIETADMTKLDLARWIAFQLRAGIEQECG